MLIGSRIGSNQAIPVSHVSAMRWLLHVPHNFLSNADRTHRVNRKWHPALRLSVLMAGVAGSWTGIFALGSLIF